MVHISDCQKMFWGVTIDAGKRYSQVAAQGFHVSMAALEVNSIKSGENVQVMLHQESMEYLLCTLRNDLVQQPLDLNFATGEEVAFSLNGSGVVHLTGYLILEDEMPSMEDFSDEDDEEAPSLVDSSGDAQTIGLKRKAFEPLQNSKKIKLLDEVDDSDDEDDDDYSEEEEGFSDDDDDDLDDDDFDSDEDDFDEDSDFDDEMDDEEETPAKINNKAAAKSPKAASTPGVQKDKNKKQEQKTPKQEQKTPKQEQKTPKQEQKTPKQEQKTPKQKGSEKVNGKEKKQGAVTPTQKAPETPVTPAGDGESAKKKKKKKKKKNKDGDSSVNDSAASTPGTPAAPTKTDSSGTPKKRVVSGGTIVEDVKVGHGPEAKPGKMVSVYYVGTLSKSNKRFDSCTEGKPFRFRLNQGEVIKGWDVGLNGMKVGGKRKITVPPSQGYGNNKQGPIPPNSTLVFEVELKAVS